MSLFSLGSDCTLARSEELHTALGDHLAAGADASLMLDASDVQTADVSLVQILVAVGRTADAKGIAVSLRSSPVVADLLTRAGLPGWPDANPA